MNRVDIGAVEPGALNGGSSTDGRLLRRQGSWTRTRPTPTRARRPCGPPHRPPPDLFCPAAPAALRGTPTRTAPREAHHGCPVRPVRYAECDQQGVAFNANRMADTDLIKRGFDTSVGDRVCCTGRTTYVMTDLDHRPTPVPDALRAPPTPA